MSMPGRIIRECEKCEMDNNNEPVIVSGLNILGKEVSALVHYFTCKNCLTEQVRFVDYEKYILGKTN